MKELLHVLRLFLCGVPLRFIVRFFFLACLLAVLALGGWYFTTGQPIINSVASFGFGLVSYYQDNNLSAMQALQSAKPDFPKPEWVHFFLGNIATRQKQNQTALQEYRLAHRLAPKEDRFSFKLARTYVLLGDTERAIAAYQEAMDLAPDKREYPKLLGILYLNQGRKGESPSNYERAADLFQTVVRKQPEDTGTRFLYAESLYRSKQYSEALGQYCQLNLQNPESPETLYSLALAYNQLGAYPQAAQTMRSAAELAQQTSPQMGRNWAILSLRFQQKAQHMPADYSQPLAVTQCLALTNKTP